jgi:phosphatidylserine/phosphatidylglycerophosphate/cardiolipin synthase-like enzyme
MTVWDVLDARTMGALLLAVAAAHALLAIRGALRRAPAISAHFSPKGGCTGAVVSAVGTARSEVLMMAYSFSCPDIAAALIAAAARRVRVVVLLDRSNEAETYSELGDLERHGIKVLIDACHAIAHNKVIVIDRHTVLTGSFNFTRQAEHSNAENLLILRDHHELAARYRENFCAHMSHCRAPGAPEQAHDHAPDHAHAHGRSHRAA